MELNATSGGIVCAIVPLRMGQQSDKLISLQDGDRWTALHATADGGFADIIDLLVPRFANLEAKDLTREHLLKG